MTLEFLSDAEQRQLDACCQCDPFASEVWRQVQRIVASRRFERVQEHAKHFLAYVVAKTLIGHAEQIKETTVAMAVFGEGADFNPLETSKVRVAASDLRQRLASYAEHEGRQDVATITLPLNTYVPEFRDRRMPVMISEFENWHPQGAESHLCKAITAEITYQLGKAGLRAGPMETLRLGLTRRPHTLRGSVESQDDLLRINASLADPVTGEILCSRSFEGVREDVLRLTATVTGALVEALARAGQIGVPVTIARGKRP